MKPTIEKINLFIKKENEIKYFVLDKVKYCRAKGCTFPATYKIKLEGKDMEFCSFHINIFKELKKTKESRDNISKQQELIHNEKK